MLSNQDIEKLIRVLASKADLVEVVERLDKVETSVSDLVNAFDGLSVSVSDLHLEYKAMANQLSRHETSINKLLKSS